MARLARQMAEALLRGAEGLPVRALEAEDRLLLVADREERARRVAARALAGEELAREALDDAPLLGAGVLGLVDEDVVDAPVEAEAHPGGLLLLEQRLAAEDEVVVVEHVARALAGLVVRDEPCAEADHRRRALEQGERAQAAGDGEAAHGLGAHDVEDAGIGADGRPGREGLAHRDVLRGEEDREPLVPAARGMGAMAKAGQDPRALDVGLRALRERLRGSLHVADGDGRDEVVEDRRLVGGLVDAGDGALGIAAMRGEQAAQVPALAGQRPEKVVEGLGVGAQHEAREGRAKRRFARRVVEHAVARHGEQRAGLVVVGDREADAHACLDREAAQQRFAE